MESRIDSGDHYFSIDVPEKSAQKILEAQPLRLEQLGFPELRLLDPARPADATPLTFPNAQENIGIDSAHHGVKDPVLRLSIKAPKVQQAISSAFK